ncbi:MAG: glycerate kinase [Bdellovibrionota bacterium]
MIGGSSRRILIASNAFKGTLTAREACEAIKDGILSTGYSDVALELCPLADGGDSFLETLCSANGGSLFEAPCVDPLGRPITAPFGLMSDGTTAVIEAASANGLRLLAPDERNPMNTTSAGVGDLILAACGYPSVNKLILGIGGSATNDGGIGMGSRLGARFTPKLTLGRGADLLNLSAISLETLIPRLREISFKVACDVDNPLFGERGASRVFGPQKGAAPDEIDLLDRGLRHLATLLGRLDRAELPGMGAAGGLGFGCSVFCGAELLPGCRLVMEALDFAERVQRADLVITGEGALDAQSQMGKVPVEAARCARSYGKPCIALVGRKGVGWQQCLGESSLSACHAIEELGVSAQDSLREPRRYLSALAARVFKNIATGAPPKGNGVTGDTP